MISGNSLLPNPEKPQSHANREVQIFMFTAQTIEVCVSEKLASLWKMSLCRSKVSQWLNAQAERAGKRLVDPKECCVFVANALTCRERSWTNLMSLLTGHWAHPGEQSPRVCLWVYRTHGWINPHELLPLFSEPYWKRADGCTEENDAPEETEEAKPYDAGINSA